MVDKMWRVAVMVTDESRREDLVKRMEAGGHCHVVVSAAAEDTAVALLREARPELVLLWLDSPLVEAMDVVLRVVDACPYAKLWLVGDSPTEMYAPLARRWGAAGYIHWRDVEAWVQDLMHRR